jgi:diguanylate cyclase (GGDEF)-like protein
MPSDIRTPHVLVVDDDQGFARLLERILRNEGYRVTCASSGESALQVLAADSADLVLLDVRMGGLSGFETCRRIKAESNGCHVPVIFMTADGRGPELLAEALSAGGADYLTKPLSRAMVLSRVRHALTQQAEAASLRRRGVEDPATGLPDRHYFKLRVEEELSECTRFSTPVCVILAEFEGFASLCAIHGTAAGDAFVARLAALLRAEARRHDLAGRLSETRFGLLLPRVPLSAVTNAAQHLAEVWRRTKVSTGGAELALPAFFAAEGHAGRGTPPSAVDLLRRADAALAHAKRPEPIPGAASVCFTAQPLCGTLQL